MIEVRKPVSEKMKKHWQNNGLLSRVARAGDHKTISNDKETKTEIKQRVKIKKTKYVKSDGVGWKYIQSTKRSVTK